MDLQESNSVEKEKPALDTNAKNSVQGIEDKPFDLESILEVLDEVENEIVSFKKKAESLATEKCSLESTLGVIISDFQSKEGVDSEEVVVKAQRLSERLDGAANIYIEIPRDVSQKEALKRMNVLLEGLEGLPKEALERLYNSTMGKDPSDRKFETVFHACSLDDQKFIKKKLERRLKQIECS